MNNNSVIEGNKLIAEFVCMRVDSIHGDTWAVGHEGNEVWHNESIENWKFHTSWDWLMPSWGKCIEIGLWMLTNGHDKLWLEKSKEIETAIVCEIDCQKAAIKIAQLIQWYNNQTPQP
jgi:hypothetical protein